MPITKLIGFNEFFTGQITVQHALRHMETVNMCTIEQANQWPQTVQLWRQM